MQIRIFVLHVAYLSSARVDGADEFVVIGLEREHIAQGRIVLRVLAIRMRILEKRQTVLIEREELRYTRQIIRAEMAQGNCQLGDLQFLIIKRLTTDNLQSHRQLFRRRADNMTRRTMIMLRAVMMLRLMMRRLSHHAYGHHRRGQ